jgi:osmotically-inducible protein OsmY
MPTKTRLGEDVRAALQPDARIKHPELIAVFADGIGTVVLHGAVVSLPQRTAAVEDARGVDGVFEVIADDLKVHPPIGLQRLDEEIRGGGLQRVFDDPRIHSNHIHLKVSHRWVTLTGYVRHEVERAAAMEDAASIDGVVGTTDRIEVR